MHNIVPQQALHIFMHSTPVPQNEQYVEYTELLFINNIYFFYKTLIVKRFLHLTLVLSYIVMERCAGDF